MPLVFQGYGPPLPALAFSLPRTRVQYVPGAA